MKKDPQEIMIDALGELLQKASESQERAEARKALLVAVFAVILVILSIYFLT